MCRPCSSRSQARRVASAAGAVDRAAAVGDPAVPVAPELEPRARSWGDLLGPKPFDASADEGVRRMTITHFCCLELRAQGPGLSSAGLARGAFVTRQSVEALLQTPEREGGG